MKKSQTIVTADFTDDFNKIVKSFKRDAVLIGIPEEKGKRDDNALINNATLLAINNFGSPINNIPPRPVMSIGIKKAQDAIAEQFKLAVQNSFSQGVSSLNTYYNRAGIIASNSVKTAINSQDGIDGPAESTLKSRKAKHFSGTKALIVTGQMRNAITYVLKGDE